MRRLRLTTLLTILSLILAAGLHATTNIVGTRALDFTLEDQNEREISSGRYSGRRFVMVLTDRAGSDHIPNWIGALEPYKDRLSFVAVADVRGVPGFLKGFIRGKFRDVYKYPVLLDWDGVLFDHYKVPEKVPTVIVVDRQGTIRYAASGKGSDPELARLKVELDRLVAAE